MIFPPFRACPRCHRLEFGITGVNDTHYFRRCRACDEVALIDLPRPQKKIIYLDQWAWSKMKRAVERSQAHVPLNADEEFYRTLFLQLDRLTKLMLVVCPAAPVHTDEALGLIRADAAGQVIQPTDVQSHTRLVRLLGHLACSVRFEPGYRILSRQTLKALRCWLEGEEINLVDRNDALHGNVDVWLPLLYGSLDAGFTSDDLRFRANAESNFRSNFDGVVQRWRTSTDEDYATWFGQEVVGTARMLKRAYDGQLTTINFLRERFGPNMGCNDPLANLMLQVLDSIRAYDGSGNDAAMSRADDFFASASFRAVANVRIGCALWAGFAHRIVRGGSNVPDPSIRNDADFIAAYLPYCDAMLVDDDCAHVLQTNPAMRDVPEHPHVYSTRSKREFADYLSAVEASTSAERRALVSDVYGDDWDQGDLSGFFR